MKYIDAEKLAKAIEDKGLDCSFVLKKERLDTLALIDKLRESEDKWCEIPSEKQKEPEDVSATTMIPSCWTEKQKEQKPVVVVPKYRVGDIVLSTKNPSLTYKILEIGHINELNYPEYKVEIFTDGNSADPANIKYIEIRHMDEWGELVEQKPTEVDESTKRLNDNWMKQHFNEYTEQKPAEWSEEDEEMLNSCISSIEESKENRYAYKENDGDTSYDREIAWLKSLRPQPQGTYKQVIHTIFGMLKDKDFYEIQPSYRVSLLNDIRVKCKDAIDCAPILDEPSWKPSEEQMNELFHALIPGAEYDCDILEELYFGLKSWLDSIHNQQK